MASRKKTYSVKEVIERLNREADDEVDDSGDDVADSEEFDTEQLVTFTGDSDDDNRAVQEANDDDEDDSDDDDDDDDDDVGAWSPPDLSWRPAAGELPLMHPFTGQSGLNIDTTGFTAEQYFQLFVSDDLFSHFVTQTNLFAEQYIDQHPNLPPYSNVRQWLPTTVSEMKKFIGLLFVIGVVKKPSLAMYWTTDPLFQTPLFGLIMPRNRFLLLLKFFHVNDNRNIPNRDDPNRDRLYKIRPLLDELFEKFQVAYTPGPSVAVDESLLLWKGRLIFKQYLPLKRARFGIKLFCLCEDSGYMYRFRVYTGKQHPATAVDVALPSECSVLSVSEKIVVYLMLPLLGEGRTIWMDNWYSSCRLYDYLHHQQTTACGTIRRNRVPAEVKNARLEVGEVSAFRSGPLLCMKFRDKKDVHMLTTQHDESMVPAPRGRGRPSVTTAATKPLCVMEYNSNMGSVDKQDQMLQPYSIARKTMKWYKKLTFHLLHVALLNSYILFQKSGGRSTFLSFQHDVAAKLLFHDSESKGAEKSEDLCRLTERHFPDTLKPTLTWTKPQARCRVCSKNGQRRDVKTYCPSCPSEPGLCAVPCFRRWHEELRYWD